MLTHLHIENYAIIEHLDIDFHRGLNTITGETGAGKSILLGALGLLAGAKAEAQVIGQWGEKLVVEGEFDLQGYNLEEFFEEQELDYAQRISIRRIVSREGKNRAFIDAQPVTLSALKQLADRLVDIHSQHETLLLARADFQIEIVDAVAANQNILSTYTQMFDSYKAAELQLEQLIKESAASRERMEYLAYQIEKIEAIGLKQGETEELEAEQTLLSNADQIGRELSQATQALDDDEQGVLVRLKVAISAVSRAARNVPQAEALAERLDSVYIELRDVASEANHMLDQVVVDPQRLEVVDERLDTIYKECRRHGLETGGELIALLSEFRKEYEEFENIDSRIEDAKKESDKQLTQATTQAAKLSASRTKTAPRIEKFVCDTLAQLGMREPKFSVSIAPTATLVKRGADQVRFLFAGSGAQSLMPMEKVASGGEMSRLMLSLKAMVARGMKLPTIIFDEIDTGVSGAVADAMGRIVESMGGDMQVINITHLAQVASKGDHHFVVYKDSGTHIKKLTPTERIEHIASMLSGAEITIAARTQAEQLIGGKPKTASSSAAKIH